MTMEPINKDGKVLVRTWGAGVHFGTLHSEDHKRVVLIDCRRIWSWDGANTLHELSQYGLKHTSKVSVAIPTITLTDAVELIPCSDKAVRTIETCGWGQPL